MNIVSIRSVHDREFQNTSFEIFWDEHGISHNFFWDEHGISHNFSASRTLKQNGVVEIKNLSLVELAGIMLND